MMAEIDCCDAYRFVAAHLWEVGGGGGEGGWWRYGDARVFLLILEFRML